MGRDFKKIRVWQLADQLVLNVYRVTKVFPKEELYGIISQLRRAAVSVPTNIAEGSARNSKKEYLQFLYIAKGSLAETEYLLYLSCKLNYLAQTEFERIEKIRIECIKTLYGLISFMKNEKD